MNAKLFRESLLNHMGNQDST